MQIVDLISKIKAFITENLNKGISAELVIRIPIHQKGIGDCRVNVEKMRL